MDDSTSGGGPAPAHWDKVYAERTLSELSWFEPEPTMSLEVIESLGLDPAAPIVDVGGGASSLVDALLERPPRSDGAGSVGRRAPSRSRSDRSAVEHGALGRDRPA